MIQLDDACALYESTRMTVQEVATASGLSYNRIRIAMDAKNIAVDKTRGHETVDIDIDEAGYLYKLKRLSLQETARALGVNKRTLRKYLEKSGITINPKGRPARWREEHVASLKHAVDSGHKTIQAIANDHNVSRQRIQQIIARSE